MSKVVCVGEILVDMIGESEQNLEQNPGFSKRAGGAPANVAVAASRLGADVSMAATVGQDEFGDFLVKRMEKEDVDTSCIRRDPLKTTLAFVALDSKGKPHFSFYRGADEKIDQEQLDFELSEDDIVHLGSLPFTDIRTADQLLMLLESTDARVSFDPNLREELLTHEYKEMLKEVIGHVDILTAAEDELDFFGGLEELRKNIDEILVTRGKNGADLFLEEEKFHEEATEVEVVDTTGAGDALTGAYLAGRTEKKTEKEALQMAVEAASLSTTEKGAMEALPHRPELE